MKLSQETKEAIKEAEADVKAGRVYSLEEVKKELGI
jgi:predicted transcriptional regulator